MCIRDSLDLLQRALGSGDGSRLADRAVDRTKSFFGAERKSCLLYTSDAADERSSVDLGGRRIIKKKNN